MTKQLTKKEKEAILDYIYKVFSKKELLDFVIRDVCTDEEILDRLDDSSILDYAAFLNEGKCATKGWPYDKIDWDSKRRLKSEGKFLGGTAKFSRGYI